MLKHIKAVRFSVAAVLFCLFTTTLVLAQEPQFRFGVAADIQYADKATWTTRYYRESLWKLQECVNDFNASDLTFTIGVGDFIDTYEASFQPVLDIYNQLNMPHYYLLGNHEFNSNLFLEQILGVYGLQKDYYSFVYNNWRFVVLNTSDISIYGTTHDSIKADVALFIYQGMQDANLINAKSYNGAIGRVQKAWLTDTLTKASCLDQKVIVFGHHTLYPPHEHNLWNDTEIVELLGKNDCVVAYMCGHNHQGNYGVKDGVHYLNLKGMVETETTNAYTIIEVYDDRLDVNGFGREPDRILSYPALSLSGPREVIKK